MKPREKGLVVCSLIFGLIAVIMIAAPYIATLFYARGMDDSAKFGVMAFFIFTGIVTMTLSFCSWITSMVLMLVSLIYNREGIKPVLWQIVFLNTICFLYYAFVIYMMFFHSKTKNNRSHDFERKSSAIMESRRGFIPIARVDETPTAF